MTDHNDWRILVVEDDPDGQAMVAHILAYMNFQIDIANDGVEAIELIQSQGSTYNAFIIDLALPRKNGWEVLAEVLANPATAHLPCLAVTAHHTNKLREEAIKAGFTSYFPKPIEATSFARELEALL